MAISSFTCRNSYTGNGSTTAFAYSFKIVDEDYIRVVKRLIASPYTETVLTLTTDYTVSGVGDSAGGTVTLLSAPSSSYTIEIFLRETQPQPTSIRNQGPYYPSTHEDAFDHLARVDMQQQDQLNRSIRQPESEAPLDMELPSAEERASTFLAFDADGLPIASTGGFDSDLPVSAFAETIVDDADAGAVMATLQASLNEDTAPTISDYVHTYDASASTGKKVLVSNLLKTPNGLTEDTAPAINDYLLTYDTSSAAAKKVLLARLSQARTANLGLSATINGSLQLVISVTGIDGSALSSTNPVMATFRSATATTGTPVVRSATSITDLTLAITASLGLPTATSNTIYVYLLDNAGTLELFASAHPFWDEARVQSTSTTATSNAVLYGANARSNMAVMLIGRVKATWTSGVGYSSLTNVDLMPFDKNSIWVHVASDNALAVTSGNAVILEDVTEDAFGAYNTTTGVFTCPASGYYSVNASCKTADVATGAVGVEFRLLLAQSGSATRARVGGTDAADASVTRGMCATVSYTYACVAGDTLTLKFNENIPACNLNGNANENWMMIRRVGPL